MAEQLKNLYSEVYIEKLALEIKKMKYRQSLEQIKKSYKI